MRMKRKPELKKTNIIPEDAEMTKTTLSPDVVMVNPMTLITVGTGFRIAGDGAEDCPRVCLFLDTKEFGMVAIEVDQEVLDRLRDAIKVAEERLQKPVGTA
jgi:hypothetical protein